jgi:hypothetical protein
VRELHAVMLADVRRRGGVVVGPSPENPRGESNCQFGFGVGGRARGGIREGGGRNHVCTQGRVPAWEVQGVQDAAESRAVVEMDYCLNTHRGKALRRRAP